MADRHLTFKRVVDGVEGVGYELDLGTHKVYSVAWPDSEATKYLVDDCERMGVKLVGLDVNPDQCEPSAEEIKLKLLEEVSALYLADSRAEDPVVVVTFTGECTYTLRDGVMVRSDAAPPFTVLVDGVSVQSDKVVLQRWRDSFVAIAERAGYVLEPTDIPEGEVTPTEGNEIVADGEGAVVQPIEPVDTTEAPADPEPEPDQLEPQSPAVVPDKPARKKRK